MDYIVQFQLNIFTLFVLLILYVIIKMRNEIISYGRRLLKILILLTALAIILEPLTWIFDGQSFFGAFYLEYITNFLLILIAPVIASLMFSYLDYKIFCNRNRVRKRLLYMHPGMLTLVILILNIFVPVYFRINTSDNSYHTERFIGLHYGLLSFMYVFMMMFLYVHRKRTQKKIIYIFSIFFLIPLVAMFIQMFNSRLYFSWNSIAIGLLVAYAFLESTSGEKDFLTKLYTRYSYETYAKHLVEEHKKFGVLLIDLDKFKEVNDVHGHHIGDLVLIDFGGLLNKVFVKEKLVSRLAGDEFIIVVEIENQKIHTCINELKMLMKTHSNHVLNGMDFSYGYQTYHEHMTLDDLYLMVDRKMYMQKEKL